MPEAGGKQAKDGKTPPRTFDGSVPKDTAKLEAELYSLSAGSAESPYLSGSITTENPSGRVSKRIRFESKEDLTKTTIVEEVGAQLEINDDDPQEPSPMEIGADTTNRGLQCSEAAHGPRGG